MKKLLLIPILVLAVSMILPVPAAAHMVQPIPLVAGQNIEVGYVEVSNTATQLRVQYVITEPGWVITETHLEVVTDPADFPTNKNGKPKIGHFTYSSSVDYIIPLADLGITTLPADVFIAAHAVVSIDNCEVQEETAWGMGRYCDGCDWVYSVEFEGGSWAEYFPYEVH